MRKIVLLKISPRKGLVAKAEEWKTKMAPEILTLSTKCVEGTRVLHVSCPTQERKFGSLFLTGKL